MRPRIDAQATSISSGFITSFDIDSQLNRLQIDSHAVRTSARNNIFKIFNP